MSFTPLIFAKAKDLLADAPKSRFPWPFAISCCVYELLAGRGLAAAAPIFVKLFHGLGIQIPFPTRFLAASDSWIFPVVFLGAVMRTIVKRFAPPDKLRLRIANGVLVFVGVVSPILVVLVFYSPLFVLIRRLQAAREFLCL